MMDNARALTIAGLALGVAALLGLFLVLTNRPDAPVALPEERAAAPTAPSQSPERGVMDEITSVDSAPVETETVAPPLPTTEQDPDERDGAGPAETADDLSLSPEDLLADIEAASDAEGAESVPTGSAPVRPVAPPAVADAEPIVFCFPGVIPLPGNCADTGILLSLATEAIGVQAEGGETQRLTVELADPAGLAPNRTATTCEQYASLKANDWGPLTTVAMRRDREMNRFCGLLAMARRAAPGRGGLEALSEDLLEEMPDEAWPTIGEAEVTNPIVLDTPGDPRVWFVQADRVEFTVRDVASADFDGDGANEVLVFTALQAADGTAVGGGYALAERAGGALRLAPTDPY